MPVHVYFKRNSEHWGILDFLNKSTEEPFRLKIDTYLKSLELVMNSEQGKSLSVVKKTLNQSSTRPIREPRSDKKKAIDWDKERSRNQVHIHQKISGSGTVYGGITNNGTNNYIESDKNEEESGESSIRRSPRSRKRVNYAEIGSSDEERESRKIRTTNNTTNSQAPRDLTSLEITPNKRPISNEEILQYSEDISVICAFDKSIAELNLIIGAELANKFSSVRDINPEIWTPDLEKYIDNVLKKSGKQFKNATLVDVLDDLFRLYCEKVFLDFYNLVDFNPTMDKKIGERKYITYQISSIYKYYERTFFNLDFDWIESHARSARITKSVTNSGIVKVDSIATRHCDGLSIWHMEAAGRPCNATDTHTLGDTKKTLLMDVLNLIAILRNYFDCSVELATKIKVFCTQVVGTRITLYALSMLPDGRFISSELATAVVPFSFHGRNQFKAIFRMMAIFHNEITKQEELMGEIDRVVLRSKGTTVRHVLKIPEGLFDINAQIDAVLRYAQLVHFPYSINDYYELVLLGDDRDVLA
ncbi:unnamed protein product [Rhizophagus irregularis]|nr:unnamed protein product [Rhizophagus irregularis]